MDSVLEYYWDDYRKWLDRYVSKETRHKCILMISFCGVFFAGFLAWRDEHEARIEAERKGAIIPFNREEIRKVVMQLWRSERIAKLKDGDTIILEYEPVPESVKVNINNIPYDLENPGLRLEGKKIIISNPQQPRTISFLDLIKAVISEGDAIKVEYIKRLQ